MTDAKEDLERDEAGAAPQDEGGDAGGDLGYDEVHYPDDDDPGRPERIEPTD